MPVILPRVTGYDDGRVACTEDELIIRHYYVSGAKHIGYPEIHEARQVPLGSLGRWRIHGSGTWCTASISIRAGRTRALRW
jgi:hypothetical protein